LVWPNGEAAAPVASYNVRTVNESKQDEAITQLVSHHMTKVQAMAALPLGGRAKVDSLECEIQHQPLDSTRARFQQTTVGRLLAHGVKSAMNVDACVIQAVYIKGEHFYKAGELFTLAALNHEVPKSCEMVVVEWPGKLMNDIVRVSLTQDPKKECAWLLNADCDVKFDEQSNITEVAGVAFDAEHVYRVAVPWDGFYTYRNNPVATAWLEREPNAMPSSAESGIPAKVLMLQWFARRLWTKLPPFETIDKDGSGTLSQDEVTGAYIAAFGIDRDADGSVEPYELEAVTMGVQMMIKALDKDGDEKITKTEYLSVLTSFE